MDSRTSPLALPAYRISITQEEILASDDVSCTFELFNVAAGEGSFEWLANVLLPKLASWAVTLMTPLDKRSENLVDKEQYAEKYQDLKVKYGREIVKVRD